MTATISALWRIEPLTPPRPIRHCSTCGGSRPFRSSGKIRLNANGRRLDAWLIYKCEVCDRTWNLPLIARANVAGVAGPDLQAMHDSDPAWVREREFDLATLSRHCDRIDIAPDVAVTKAHTGDRPNGWSVIALAVVVPLGWGQRLDRLLAHEFGLTRSELQAMRRGGGMELDRADDRILRRPSAGSVTLRFVAARLTEKQRSAVVDGIWGRSQDAGP